MGARKLRLASRIDDRAKAIRKRRANMFQKMLETEGAGPSEEDKKLWSNYALYRAVEHGYLDLNEALMLYRLKRIEGAIDPSTTAGFREGVFNDVEDDNKK